MSNKYSLTLVGTLPVVQWRIQRADKIDLGIMQKEVGGFIEQIHLYHDLEAFGITTIFADTLKTTSHRKFKKLL